MLSDGENGRAAKAEQMAEDIANALVSGTEHDLLAATAPLIKDKPLFPESMERLQLLLRDACLLKNNVNVQVPAREVCDKLRRKLSLKAADGAVRNDGKIHGILAAKREHGAACNGAVRRNERNCGQIKPVLK